MSWERLKAGVAAKAIAVVTAVALGAVAVLSSLPGKHARVEWQGPPPAGVRCLRATVRASSQALALFDLESTPGGYVHTRVCGPEAEEGSGPSLPAGMDALEATYEEEAWDGGQPQLEAWTDSFPCACAPDATCEWLLEDGGWESAPKDTTLAPGRWRGGCVRKPCTEFAGSTSMVEACR